jgi:hypothetical protein
LKRALKDQRSANIQAVTQELCNIPKSVAQYCLKDLTKRFDDARRTYFEADSLHQTGRDTVSLGNFRLKAVLHQLMYCLMKAQ